MKTKLLSLFIFVIIGFSAFAQIPISTPAQLNAVRTNLSANYILVADIDLSGYFPWVPIGDNATPFTGSFDGAGHKITNLVIAFPSTVTDYVGLFGYAEGATIKNLNIERGAVYGTVCNDNTTPGWHYVGMLVGYADSASIFNNIASGQVCGTAAVGGMAGGIYNGTDFHNNEAHVAVSASNGNMDDPDNIDYAEEIGGLVGQSGNVDDYTSGVYLSFAVGDVNAPEANVVGGLVGEANGETYQNYATGDVTGRGYVGGLVGSSYTVIHDSYATGGIRALADAIADPLREVEGTGAVGGIVGGSRKGSGTVGNGVNHTYSRFDLILGYQAGGIVGVTEDQTPSIISCNAALGDSINGRDTRGSNDRIYRIYDNDTTDTSVSIPNWANRDMALASLDGGTVVGGIGAGIDADVSTLLGIVRLFMITMPSEGCGFDFDNIWYPPSTGSDIYPTLQNVGAVLPISTPEPLLPDNPEPDFGFGGSE
jgi:hypothetical protein